ncbi:ShlB/FhaC/HecB family hemolysin secretion/activation protein [Actomonas aquatica]|uniref:ShlB/FhaC/HecB family hemolysin secretion/activation protein n=1 Tax=Actomonas aquatica TaxID=2866162 RepID=A0ABZ1CDU9_9BACT|nr:ShlB/FhaC/HecB family hemolysin secretion/activation protein [Opitutus sp. WL0086]WRQ89863.1 ShlB/FhaC/HecB family hemolysin secretion/activation protein [Opitutus sp. WL0086]
MFSSFLRPLLLALALTGGLTVLRAQEADTPILSPELRLSARPDETVILPALRGVRLVNDPAQVEATGASREGGIRLDGVATLTEADLAGVADAMLGEPASRESLERLRAIVRGMLTLQGHPFSVVYAPPQDVTDGVVHYVVMESSLGQVRVEGNRHFPEASYLSRFDFAPGAGVDAAALRAGVDRLNRNSFRNVATRVEAGAEPGTTDIVIQVQDRLPWRVFGGYSNTGTQTTTEDRLSAGVNWGNALGLGHMATLQWSSDLEAEHSRSLSGNYTADLAGNRSLSFFGAYSEIESVPNGGFSQEGMSWQAGLQLDQPLRDLGSRYTHGLQFGADFKVSDNNLEFALPPFVIPISDNLTHIAQVRAQYRGTLSDDWGATTWGLRLTASPGGLTDHNGDGAFRGSRAGAKARYAYASMDVFRETSLAALLPGASWTVRGELQVSTNNLLGSEQYSAGGSGSVRGYEQGEVVGDNALFFSQELRLPTVHPARSLLKAGLRDGLTPYLFHDYARVWNVDRLPGERTYNLHSVGIGFTYQLTAHANVRVAHGWQLRDSGSSDTGDNSRLHVAANVSF